MRTWSSTLGWSWLLIAALACTGSIERDGSAGGRDRNRPGSGHDQAGADDGRAANEGDEPSGSSSNDPKHANDLGSVDPVLDPTVDCDQEPIDPGPAPLHLLTRTQYLNTVRALVGEVPGLQDALGPSTEASAFGLVQPDIAQVELEGFQSAADLIAAHVVGDQALLDAVAPCASDAVAEDCARMMIERFGARAYRAPINEDADIERHLLLFAAGADTSYAHGIELLLRGMLQSPRFLYQVERGSVQRVSDQAVKLSGPELEARLSYLVWNTLPDAELQAAAQGGELDSDAGLNQQLTRLLADPRGTDLVQRFLEGLFHLAELDRVVKDASMFPEWQTPELRQALRDQARSFFDDVLEQQGGKLDALLTSRTTFVNQTLAELYGVSAGQAFEPLQLEPGHGSGVLTLPAVLARAAKPDESSPIYRGKLVREVLLCQQLPSPPANVPKPPEVEAGVSTRERLRQHETDPVCAGCHQLLDPIGFGFEHFDAIGRYRTQDGGKDIDVHGELVQTLDIDGRFEGIDQLGAKLAASSEVESCIARQWFRFALSRFERDFDVCSMQRLLGAFQASDRDLNTLAAAVIATDAFRYRRPIEAAGP